MNQYRVTKYDPQYRDGGTGAYRRTEWTDVSDVGRSFAGVRFTMEDYERAEQRHIDFLTALASEEAAFPLTIQGFESYDAETAANWHNGAAIDRKNLPLLVRAVLRSQCWCRLEGSAFFIHFGWDYYMYVGCSAAPSHVAALAESCGLFSNEMISPHHPAEEE